MEIWRRMIYNVEEKNDEESEMKKIQCSILYTEGNIV